MNKQELETQRSILENALNHRLQGDFTIKRGEAFNNSLHWLTSDTLDEGIYLEFEDKGGLSWDDEKMSMAEFISRIIHLQNI